MGSFKQFRREGIVLRVQDQNKAAFGIPTAGIQGNLGRNALRGFGMQELDFTLRRQFPIHEAVALQFRADIFNVTSAE